MRTETVEVYSDITNVAIIRLPGRQFPGMLIQGDALHNLSSMAADALAGAEPQSDHWHDIKELADQLQSRVSYYAQILREHGMELPFPD
jgi:hypothetical protein